MSRRALLEGLALGAGAAAAGAAVWPLAAAVVEPLATGARAEAPWVDVAGEKEVRADAPLKAALRVPVRDGFFTTLLDLGAVWLRRGPGGAISALSGTCPHLGCGIGFDPQAGFACPCHDSRFSPDGAWQRGPSPRSLDPLPVRIAGGRVQVQALRFATGIQARREI